ncbi:MAG: CPBP family intramembrane metalloprotease [Chloroflexi bacterium]|nr:CPBP family intramembrane metalloprotease [Chloroflexota bacterium]
MTPFILTPEVKTYLITAVITYVVGSGTIAHLVSIRLLRRPQRFLTVYIFLMALTFATAMSIGISPWLSPIGWIAALPLGYLTNLAAQRSERLLQQRLRRGRRGRASSQRVPGLPLPRRQPSISPADRLAISRTFGGVTGYQLLILLLMAATLEELLYRGILVTLIWHLTQPVVMILALASSTIAFALAHQHQGSAEFLGKLILGCFLLGIVLASQSVIPAIICHVSYNWSIWRGHHALRHSAPTPQAAAMTLGEDR